MDAKILYIFLPHPEPEVGTVTPAGVKKKDIYYSLHIYTYMYVCMYLYTYIHTCTHAHMPGKLYVSVGVSTTKKKKIGNACG